MVTERRNRLIVTEATLLQSAVSSILSKKAGKAFEKSVGRLNVKTVPFSDSEADP